jgi:peptide/nickel transport system substrate-binding protein
MFTRRSFNTMASALPLGLAVAPARAATPHDTLVIVKAIDDIITMDPGEAYEISGIEIVTNIYDRLVRYEPEDLTKMVGAVAQSWTVSADGKNYSFKIRPGLKFHSGNPVTAEDAAWSLQRLVILDKTPSFLLTQLGWNKDNVRDLVKAPDAGTLTFAITQEFAPSLVMNLMSSIAGSVVDKKVAMSHEANGDLGNTWLKTNSAGSGPYKLVSWKANESVTIEAYPGFRMGAPHLKRIVSRHVPEAGTQRLMLEKGDADVARGLTPDQLAPIAGNKNIRVDGAPGANTWYALMNLSYAPLANPKVRRALRAVQRYAGS